MTKTSLPNSIIPDEILLNKIYQLRGHKIMLDRDLAELYGVKAIRLREQVKRNINRFPLNFMFQLNETEVDLMVSQNAIPSLQILGGALPYAFTEHGILMLSNVLRSEKAIKMSIRIIELFVELREVLYMHKDVSVLVERIEKRLSKQDDKIKTIVQYLNKFIEQQNKPRPPIGFRAKP